MFDDPTSCLSSKLPCDVNRDCNTFWYDDKCLASLIRPFIFTIFHVSCCFKCCLNHTLQRHNLQFLRQNEPISKEYLNYKQKNILMSISASTSISDMVYMPFEKMGRPAVYRVSTIISDEKVNELNGRNIVLISYINESQFSRKFSKIANQNALYGNPRVTIWFSNQLISLSPPTNGTTRKKYFEPVSLNNVYKKFHLLPSGVRNHVLLFDILYNSSSVTNYQRTDLKSKWLNERHVLLNCGCIQQYILNSEMISVSELDRLKNRFRSCQNTHSKYNSIISSNFYSFVNSTSDFYISSDKFLSLKTFYHSLIKSKFTIICENPLILGYILWETLAAGSIPIMLNSFQSFHPSLTLLLADLPILYISSWNQLSTPFLIEKSKYFIENSHLFDISKVYFPHWLQQFTGSLLGGSFLRRPWTQTLASLTNRLNSPSLSCHKLQYYKNYSTTKSIRSTSNQNRKYARKKPDFGKTRESVYHRILIPTDKNKTYDASSLSTPIEIIIPRCCEKQGELHWLTYLLDLLPELHASVYYKCAHCLPKSKASLWYHQLQHQLQDHRSSIFYKGNSSSTQPYSRDYGTHILEDSFLVRFGLRVRQESCFDQIYNGKEASAYLQHIVNRYESLSTYTYFLHSDPASHINLELLIRTLLWLHVCNSSMVRIHLLVLDVSNHYFNAVSRFLSFT